ncbi:hypothetical protein [Deinococcus apachensis]|uniref:hypothetical protein n=1 Tax=Deinococcus apachensis TaxID=309886 RepID=UPI00035C5EB5|nr:hypothetical protein [Deinococcus apachensis]
MQITEPDALLILRPELRDPELERRRLDTLARSEWLIDLATPEHLQAGIPLPDRPRKPRPR